MLTIGRLWCLPHRRMYLAAFLLDFSVAIGLTVMPFFIFDRLAAGTALSGTVGAVQMAVYAAGCLVSAWIVSLTRSSLYWAVGGIAIFALLFTLIPWVHTPALCIIAASAPFLGLASAWPAMQSWLGQEPDPETRARHLAGFNTATAFGFTLSPLLAGPLYDMDFRLPFIALLAMCAAVICLVVSLLPRTAAPLPEHQEAQQPKEAEPVRLTAGLLCASWMATLTSNGLFAAVRSVYPMRVQTLSTDGSLTLAGGFHPAFLDGIGPATTYSWLAFLLSLSTVTCFIIMGRTRAWRNRFSFLIAGQIVAAASFILLSQTRSLAIMALCFVIVGANFGLCFFASLYYSLARAKESHRRAAVNEGVLGAGGFIGAIGLGYAAESAGIAAAFQWTPLFVAAGIVIQTLLLRAGHTKEL